MRLKYIITSFMVFMILIVGCTSPELKDHSEVTVSQSLVGIDTKGGTVDITLSTTAEWTITSAEEDGMPEWLTISKLTGTANPEGEKITFSATETTSTRETTILITVDGKVQHVIIRQVALTGSIEVTPVSEITTNGIDGKTYYVRGVLVAINNSTYGNLVVEDATGQISTYGTLDADGQTENFESWGLAIGDEILISGPWKTQYNNLNNVTIHEIKKSLLSVEPTTIEMPDKNAGEVEIIVTCKTGPLDVNIDADWLKFKSIDIDGEIYTVKFSAEANETVQPRTATVTLSITGNSEVKPAVVTVSQKGNVPPVSTIADAIASGEYVNIEGTVVAINSGSYIISDGTGTIYINQGELEPSIGDKVNVIGAISTYNKGVRIRYPDVEEKLESGLTVNYPDAKVLDAAAADLFVSQEAIDVEYISLTGVLSYDSYINIAIEGTTNSQGSISYANDEQKALLEPLNGKVVTIKGYAVQVASSKYINIVMTSVE